MSASQPEKVWTLHFLAEGYPPSICTSPGLCPECFDERVHGISTIRVPVVEQAALDEWIKRYGALEVIAAKIATERTAETARAEKAEADLKELQNEVDHAITRAWIEGRPKP